jgi:TolA-binding protein
MKFIIKIILAVFFLQLFHDPVFSQRTAIYQNPEAEYRIASELFQNEKYSAAQKKFTAVINALDNYNSPLRIEAEYFEALCALELFNGDAEYKLNQFQIKHPSNSRSNLINFQLGKLTYRNKKYSSAKKYFEEVDLLDLDSEQLAEYNFKYGYSCFKTDDIEKAKSAFNATINTPSKYSSPAAYFLAHMNYESGNYEASLEQFNALKSDKNFSSIAPFYITQIHYLLGDYQLVINEGEALIKHASQKRKTDLNRVLGGSHFRLGNYEKALPYLIDYQNQSTGLHDNSFYYEIGYSYYKTNKFQEAVEYLQKATSENDTMAQYAYYYLGASYLKTNQKKFASTAFSDAYKNATNSEIKEDALFNMAQLAYDMSSDPYNHAIKSLKDYLVNYPNSSRNDEAYRFLFKISMATGNYQDALESLENIKKKDADYNTNYQKICFLRGIELFNQFDYEAAVSMFKKASEKTVNRQIMAESIFWTGEAFYRQKNYWGSKKYYSSFLKTPGAKDLGIYNMANYNLGYVYFKSKDYKNAFTYYKKFIAGLSNEDEAIVADAFLRMADAQFISKNYKDAIKYYDNAIKINAIGVDYALFQKAIASGIILKYDQEIASLNHLVKNHPNSTYLDDALFELGNTYLIINDKENALLCFKQIENDHPNSDFAVKSRLKSGLIFYNSGQNKLALSTFKNVVKDYPSTPYSKEALVSIRNIYMAENNVDEFFTYAQDIPNADFSVNEKDSIFFVAAENKYMEGDCNSSSNSFEQYIEKFPEGAYVSHAAYYRADCYAQNEKYKDALKYYEIVLNRTTSEFTADALRKASGIAITIEEYEKSLDYFTRLIDFASNEIILTEAYYGQMISNSHLGNSDGVITTASKLLKMEKLTDEMKLEALILKANALYDAKDILLAKADYKTIVGLSKSKEGAKSKYMIAKIEFEIANYEEAEKNVFELINNYAAYDYWVANSFILLSDIYLAQGNDFQAKQTLQSILDNYEGDELKKIALDKFNSIIEAEQKENERIEKADSLENQPEVIEIEGEAIDLN